MESSSRSSATVTSGDRGSENPRPPPLSKFKGSGDDFIKFHRSFMLLSLASNWNDLDRARNLPLYLEDTVLDLLEANNINMFRPTKETFANMIELLINTYRATISPAAILHSFYSTTWDGTTPYAEFCFSTGNLLRKTLPTVDENTAKILIIEQCSKSLPEFIKRITVASKPQSIAELVRLVQDQLSIPNHASAATYTNKRKFKPEKFQCKKCGSHYHKTEDCRGTAFCKICNKKGHLSYICKRQKVNNITWADNESNSPTELNYTCFTRRALCEINNQFTIPIFINQNKHFALIDTGSSISIIKGSLVINNKLQREIDLISADGTPIYTQGMANVNFRIKDEVFLWPMVVSPNLVNDCILGRDFLSHHKINVDCYNNLLTRNKQSFTTISVTESTKFADVKPYKFKFKDEPFHIPTRKVAFTLVPVLKEKIDKMLVNGVIRRSSSPYSSPVMMVKKKNGDHRVCVDFRKLNTLVIPEQYPIPLIHDIISTLKGSKIF